MERVVIITGGTSGIGLATAKRFLTAGERVVTASVDGPAITSAALEYLSRYGSATHTYLNVADDASCREAVADTVSRLGRIDVLVNAAGVRGKVSSPLESDFGDIENTVNINMLGAMRMGVYAAKQMKTTGGGVIINVSSISGELVTAEDFGYHCAKAGLNMATRILAKEVSPYGIRCVAIAPGGVKAGMNSDEWEKEGKKLHIRDKLLMPEEIASAIYLLSTDDASAINGSVVLADDGYCCFKGIF